MKQDTAPISNTTNVSDSLIERAMLTLDDYLNAGCKETRKQAAENAKFLYKEYYGKEYVNRNERSINYMDVYNKDMELTEQPNLPVVKKSVVLNSTEIAFIMNILQQRIEFAPEENTQYEIDLTTSVLKKLIY